MKIFLKPIAACIIMFSLSACSINMAANQPDKKDLSLFAKGTPQSSIEGEYGIPFNSSVIDGKRSDLYVFTNGYSESARVARAYTHAILDTFTLALWEFFGTPIEYFNDGDDMRAEIGYDTDNKIERVKLYSEGKLIRTVN